MKQTQLIMGMPISIEVIDPQITKEIIQEIFSWFLYIDQRFSPYKAESEVTKINEGMLTKQHYSSDMKKILKLAEQTKKATDGYFDVYHKGKFDPSGIVKGWAIYQASKLLKKRNLSNFYIDAGGDIQVSGKNSQSKYWTVGIRNPFNRAEIVKVLSIFDKGVATSGTAIRGQHVYNPLRLGAKLEDVVSLTVIGPNVLEADRFATAAFAMQRAGITFIEKLPGFEGYMIDKDGMATATSGLAQYL